MKRLFTEIDESRDGGGIYLEFTSEDVISLRNTRCVFLLAEQAHALLCFLETLLKGRKEGVRSRILRLGYQF